VVPSAAQADTPTTLYVYGSNSACSDSGASAGTQATPFCTIQAAVDVVKAGQTIGVAGGTYAPFTVSASGAAGSPITITYLPDPKVIQSAVSVVSSGTDAAVTVSDASYVNLVGMHFRNTTAGPAVVIAHSDHVTLDLNIIDGRIGTPTAPASSVPTVQVISGSSAVTVSRNLVMSTSATASVQVDDGTDITVTTNELQLSLGGRGITAAAAPSTVITSNSVDEPCGLGIGITDGSTGASVENNVVNGFMSVCPMAPSQTTGILVDSSSVSGSTVDYDNVYGITAAEVGYSWAGNVYGSSSALYTATGQGAHDIDSATVADSAALSGTVSSQIDSANADAPGELSTDHAGYVRVDDPVVADRGAGSKTYYDRGATELQPAGLPYHQSSQSSQKAPVGGTISFSATVGDPWGSALMCAFSFGDGASVTVAATGKGLAGGCTVPHAYATLGTYSVTLTTTSTYGSTLTTQSGVAYVVSPAPLSPSISFNSTGVTSVDVYVSASSSWDIRYYDVDYGDGTKGATFFPAILDHVYAKPGTYTVKLTATDAGGESASVSTTYTTWGEYYSALDPTRILDTRTGTGVADRGEVAGGGTVRLKIAGNGPIPATGLTAVALNLTVTTPAAGGYITVYPDGMRQPNTSNVNFGPGQTVANLVITQVGADGYIDLTNVSAGGTHLVADVAGYYSGTSTDGYAAISPVRLLDTRSAHATVPAGGTTRVYLGDRPGASAATMNLTVTNAAASGYITAYPSGGSPPKASNLNFTAHQTVPNEVMVKVGADGYVQFVNSSAGSVDLVVDLTGYFTSGSGLPFAAVQPLRLLDTRTGLGVPSKAPVEPGGTVDCQLARTYGSRLAAIAANVTVTGPTAGGYITIYPDDETTRPLASVVNFRAGQTVPNATTVGVGSGNTRGVDLYNGSAGSTDLILDVFGFYGPVTTP